MPSKTRGGFRNREVRRLESQLEETATFWALLRLIEIGLSNDDFNASIRPLKLSREYNIELDPQNALLNIICDLGDEDTPISVRIGKMGLAILHSYLDNTSHFQSRHRHIDKRYEDLSSALMRDGTDIVFELAQDQSENDAKVKPNNYLQVRKWKSATEDLTRSSSKQQSGLFHDQEVTDFIIVAAPQELHAILKLVDSGFGKRRTTRIDKQTAYHLIIPREENEIECILMCAISKGVDATVSLIRDIIERRTPRSIVMVGMMGGIQNKVGILEVVAPKTIYDGRALGTREGRLIRETETSLVHSLFSDAVNHVGVVEHGEDIIDVVKSKKTITTGAKIDDVTHEMVVEMMDVDGENIVGFEMEGYGVYGQNTFQQLKGRNVIYGMIKGVADYGSVGVELDADERCRLERISSREGIGPPFDPTGNKPLKRALQYEATVRSFLVAMNALRFLA